MMKRILILMVILTTISSSCEEVVEVDLNEIDPRLVIDASIIKDIENGNSTAVVKLSTTTPFFNSGIDYVNNATVTVTNSDGEVFTFEEISDGIFEFNNFDPQSDVAYTLEVVYEGDTYSATETLQTVVPLEYVEQRNDGGFSGEDIELKAFFTDPIGVENYYFFEGLSARGDVYDTFYDEFFDGNPIFGFYLVEDLQQGDEVTFYLHGVNEQFYNFMFVLLQQSTDQSDGPFETQPATVRGNIINESNSENFPLGYFRVSEVSVLSYIVE
jgi:hypothetical protein